MLSDLINDLRPLLPDLTDVALWGLEGALTFGVIALLTGLIAGLLANIPIVGPFAGYLVKHIGSRLTLHFQKELQRMADEAVQAVETQAAQDFSDLGAGRVTQTDRPLLTTGTKKKQAALEIVSQGAALLDESPRMNELESLLEHAHTRMKKRGGEQKAVPSWVAGHESRKQ